jgi:dienelactone hydrolase
MISLLAKGFLAAMLLLPTEEVAQSKPPDEFDAFKARGKVILSLKCLDDPSQSYALYLPSQYSPDGRWPIVYAFDPSAEGKTPVERYRGVAEKYGYILAGSNNSQNGPAAPAMAAAQAVWLDTHRRLSIDKDRVYTTGFSGGARFATSFALACHTCSIAGAIIHGAGYPAELSGGASDPFLYYAAIGNADFNLPEILDLRRKKEEQGTGFKVKVYPGQHDWAPPEVFQDAVEWLELKAMQAGTRKPDADFIHRLYEQTKLEAVEAENKGNALDQFYALRSLAVDFKDLEVSAAPEFESRLVALKGSGALKRARRTEQHEMDRQRFLTATASGELLRLATAGPEEQIRLRREITSVLLRLWRQSNSAGDDRGLYTRALNQLWVQGIEEGEQQLRQQHLSQAAVYFELMGEAVPDRPWPLLMLAKVRVRAGDNKGALKALEAAVKHGLKNPASVSQDPEIQPLASDPSFRRIIEGMGAAR